MVTQRGKWRDPSHGRFLSPASWKELCAAAGLTVLQIGLTPFKQPDLNWYFETASTSEENRILVRQAVATAPERVKDVLRLSEEDGKTVWWWPRIGLLAAKP